MFTPAADAREHPEGWALVSVTPRNNLKREAH